MPGEHRRHIARKKKEEDKGRKQEGATEQKKWIHGMTRNR
jgi:hypothetical protein